jgi:hypothetical protein
VNGPLQPGVVVVATIAAAPATINIGGYEPEIVSLILSMLTVVVVRLLFGFTDHTPGAMRRELSKILLAAIFVFSYDLSQKPGPGIAVVVGAGVGFSIVALVEIAGTWIVDKLNAALGRKPGDRK